VRKLSDKVERLILERTAEGAREAALLWIVFSALDALITGRLTPLWVATNTAGAIAVWASAIYIEIRAMAIGPKEHS
jgi:hypothetical protein